MFSSGFKRLTVWSLTFSLAGTLLSEGRKRWGRLEADEQRELRRLVTASKGRHSRLSPPEQAQLWRLVKKALGSSHDHSTTRSAEGMSMRRMRR